jgi:rod shape determining protein RodA
MMFFAGIRWIHTIVLFCATAIAGVIGWFFVFADYQKERLMVFIDPSLDPLVSGYNVAQAKIAIGSGGLFGKGLGFGSQSQLQFLPESQTDFVFSVIGEELGFIGICLLLLACILVLWRIVRAARLAKDHFTKFLLLGIFGLFSVQFIVNISVNLALLPTTGIALPFVSYGGTSLLASLVLIGIVQSITIRRCNSDERGCF